MTDTRRLSENCKGDEGIFNWGGEGDVDCCSKYENDGYGQNIKKIEQATASKYDKLEEESDDPIINFMAWFFNLLFWWMNNEEHYHDHSSHDHSNMGQDGHNHAVVASSFQDLSQKPMVAGHISNEPTPPPVKDEKY